MDTTLIVPGLHGSGHDHWQTWFERQIPDCIRVMQTTGASPICRSGRQSCAAS